MVIRSFLSVLILFVSFSANAAEKLRVYLDWFPNIEFAGMYAAEKKGWYKEAGIDVEYVFNGLEIVPGVLAGQADIGMHSGHDLLKHIGNGAKIKAFAAQYQLNPNSIVVAKDSGIAAIRDLKGKTLGVFSPQEYDMFRVMLGHHGLSLDDVKFKPINTFNESELIAILKRKEVDGFIAWEFNWTITFSLLGYDVLVFPGYENGFQFYGTVFFAPTDYIKKNRALLTKFLTATFRGWREVYRDPEHYARRVVEDWYPKDKYINGSKELTLRQQGLELKLRKRYFFEGVGKDGIGRMSTFKWKKSLEIAKKHGLLPKDSPLRVSDIADDSIWGRP